MSLTAMPLDSTPSALPRPPVPPSQASLDPADDAFFRHHGLWAPGVRLFRRLGFRVKAALISVVLLMPVLLLQVLGGLLSNAVRFSDRGQVTLRVRSEIGRAHV